MQIKKCKNIHQDLQIIIAQQHNTFGSSALSGKILLRIFENDNS